MDMFGFSKMAKFSSHKNKESGWPLSGASSWGRLQGSPYTWDNMNTSRDGRGHLTNQVSQSSSLEEVHQEGIPPVPRLVELRRDPILGFGFVAGSEKPVVVRSVTPGGPSEGKLMPRDEIIMINDEAVGLAPRERVIDLVRSCKECILLTVVQPCPSPKSAFISEATKAKLKSNPVKVRFAEEVIINGPVPNLVKDNSLLFMPSVLKVYLENAQTKSFRFDSSTSIKDVILTLQEKLSIKCIEHFSLMLEQRTEGCGNRLLLLHEQEMLTQVTQRPGSEKMKCLFRISFVPRDPVELLRRDAVAFEYLYVQSCNDVVLERFGPELKYDAVLRLAALQMYILIMTTKQSQKVSLKYIQKEWGLSLFLPPTVLSSMKQKNIKKALTHILKTNQNLVPPGKKLTALQAKVHYLRYLSELRLYGGREFKSLLLQGEKQTEVTLLVSPRYGISHVINARTNLVALLADFSHVNRIEILTEDETNVRLELHVLDVRPITLIMESSDAMNLACLTAGYYRLLVDSRRSIFSMAHCNSISGDDSSQDRVLEWPYSTSLGDCEDLIRTQRDVNKGEEYLDTGQRENAISAYFHESENHDKDLEEGRRPVPPPLPPSIRHKPQDSPRSPKVSFIFGGNPQLSKSKNACYERLLESPDMSEHRAPLVHNSTAFQYSGGPHVYSNIGGQESSEEPLLRHLCYAETTDYAEDDDDASCEEDSTGGTPVGDDQEGSDENYSKGGGGPMTAASKATFLTLSGPSDDIIDLTSLPPPERDDDLYDDEDDTLLETLNLAIAAPPPGFQDSSDEDAASDGRLQSMHEDDDIPVSLIDAISMHEDGGGSGEGETSVANAVMNTLQGLEAMSVSEERPPPPPPPSGHGTNPGVYTSRDVSPQSSSDSGNETNSSEITEICEMATAHRLTESRMHLLVATREGYQPLLEEQTEFPVSPNTAATLQKKPHNPSRHPQPPVIPHRRRPQFDIASSGACNLELKSQTHVSTTVQRCSSTTPGGKHKKKSADSGGKYNTFSTREGHCGNSGSNASLSNMDQHTSFYEQRESQRRHNYFLGETSVTDSLGVNSLPRERYSPHPTSAITGHLLDAANFGECSAENGAVSVEQDEHLVVASLLSSNKNSKSEGSNQVSDIQSDHQAITKQSVARLCEYHLAKRISGLQGEVHSSLQGSLSSSFDAGGSTNSSVCVTPNGSPLGCGPVESKLPHLQRHPLSSSSPSLLRVLNYEDNKTNHSIPGHSIQAKDLHPHADPVLLRKMLPNIHPPAPGAEKCHPLPTTQTMPKETTSSANKRLHNDLQAKQQGSSKGFNQKEGSEAYRQLINYLTVSQMHQGGKLHGAGMGGAVKKDTRRYITSNPQLVEMAKNRSNTIGRCQCMPSSTSSPFLTPNSLNQGSATLLEYKNPGSYHSSTLPAKLKGSPDLHAQKPNNSVDLRRATSERRCSFSSLEGELEQGGMEPKDLQSVSKRDAYTGHDEGFITVEEREAWNTNCLPSRSRIQPSGSGDDGFKSEQREKHAIQQFSHPHLNDSLFLPAPNVPGEQSDLNPLSLEREDHPFIKQGNGTRVHVTSPTPKQKTLPTPSPPPPLVSVFLQPKVSSSNSKSTNDSIYSPQYRQSKNHIQTHTSTLPQTGAYSNSLQRGRELKRSASNVTPCSASMEVMFEKPSRSRSQQLLTQPMHQQGETKVQRRPTRKRLSKSYSQGSVSSQTCWSTGNRADSRRASVAFPLQKDGKQMKGSQKLDNNPWRCNGPFSYCFFKRKTEGEEDEIEWERRRRSCGGTDIDSEGGAISSVSPCESAMDSAGEQIYGEVLHSMSFSDRLARINTLKDHMYSFPAGFTDARRDASELIALVRSSIGHCDRGAQMPHIQDISQCKQLLSVESKELGRACRRMAQAHGSPEEMLLSITCSFQVLCCLCEACMCLVKAVGPSASHQQREVVAKVDEVVMNYICLLKAAETAAVGAPGENSVKALFWHSSTMSAIANALTRSLKTLLTK